jgi:hypothetical protein
MAAKVTPKAPITKTRTSSATKAADKRNVQMRDLKKAAKKVTVKKAAKKKHH